MQHRLASVLAAVLAMGSVVACHTPPKGPDVGALIAELKSADSATSGRARLALLGLGDAAVLPLVDMLRTGDARERNLAATTLWGLGPKAAPAVPELSAMLADADPQMRITASMALQSIGPPSAPAMPTLVALLRDGDVSVRQQAARTLGGIGRGALAAVPALTEAARIDATRPAAEDAIRRIQGR
jgi:HEAT repeat protein